jgi:hypothetical protein
MKKIFLLFITVLLSFSFGQIDDNGRLDWAVRDREFSREILRAYIDALTEADPMADLTIQETDELRVTMQLSDDNKLELKQLMAKNRSGQLNKLIESVVIKMDSELIEKLINRQYKWDYLSDLDVGNYTGEIVNVFEERNHKQVRDAFWWTHRRVNMSVPAETYVRINPKWAFSIEFGREDIGFIGASSQTMNLGLTTEIFKSFLIIPVGIVGVKSEEAHPLDGSYGAGLKFDSPQFGGSVTFQDMMFRNNQDINFYNGKTDSSKVVYNSYSGSIYYSFTSRIGSDDKGFRLPLGSLRIHLGFVFAQFHYGNPSLESDQAFNLKDQTEGLSNFQGLIRAEYASDMNENMYNDWKSSFQLNLGFQGFGNVQFSLSKTILKWMSFNLSTSYFWNGINFEDGVDELGEPIEYNWNPGWYVTPSISIYL